MFVIAMGKMGARELNYSSDIDLIVLFDETRHDPDDYADLRRGFIRVTQGLVKLLSEITAEGYVFRVDLRLRPDPSATPVCIATEPAEHYYESVGRTWERAAYIKARACAGAIAAGEAFLERLRPVHLAPAPRLRRDRGRPGHAPAHPHPQGADRPAPRPRPRPQARPGRHPRDRVLHPDPPAHRRRPRPRPAPARRRWPPSPPSPTKGWVERDAAGDPRRGLRRPPRRSSTGCRCSTTPRPSACPRTADDLARLADFCGEPTPTPSTPTLAAPPRHGQRAHRALLRARRRAPRTPPPRRRSSPTRRPPARRMAAWARLPALRSERARAHLPPARARARCAASPAPPAPTRRWSRSTPSCRGLPAGVQIFSLMQANPPLLDLLVDICGTAPELARYLGAQHRRARRGDQPRLLPAARAAPPSSAPTSPRRLAEAADYEAALERSPALDEGAPLPHRRPPAARHRRARGRGRRLLRRRRGGDRRALAGR